MQQPFAINGYKHNGNQHVNNHVNKSKAQSLQRNTRELSNLKFFFHQKSRNFSHLSSNSIYIIGFTIKILKDKRAICFKYWTYLIRQFLRVICLIKRQNLKNPMMTIWWSSLLLRCQDRRRGSMAHHHHHQSSLNWISDYHKSKGEKNQWATTVKILKGPKRKWKWLPKWRVLWLRVFS